MPSMFEPLFGSSREPFFSGNGGGGGGGASRGSPRPAAGDTTPIPGAQPRDSGAVGSLGDGDGATADDCLLLIFFTRLNSTDQAVLADLRVNEVLALEFQSPDSRRGVVAKTADGRTAGSITSADLARLLRCMGRGLRYQAIVTSLKGGACDVRVSPVPRSSP